MERKPWEPFVAVKAEMIGGVPYVEARYLQECVAEIERLKEELEEATDYSKTTYLTAAERDKLQAVLNASLRQVKLRPRRIAASSLERSVMPQQQPGEIDEI